MKRIVLAVVALLLLQGAVTPVAIAGGWAVVELEKPLPSVVVGQASTIQFRVLAHGRPEAAIPDLDPVVALIHRESGNRMSVNAVATKEDPAIYEATLTLREVGPYKWSITPGPYAATAMPTLTAYATAAEAAKAGRDETAATPGASVRILDASFSPARLVVEPGTTVEFMNTSLIPHQVVWTDLDLDDSTILRTDGTFRVRFDGEGSYGYFCGPHPSMTGMIVVAENAPATPGA